MFSVVDGTSSLSTHTQMRIFLYSLSVVYSIHGKGETSREAKENEGVSERLTGALVRCQGTEKIYLMRNK